VSNSESTWDPKILADMKPGAVTFAWDDGEIQTVSAPEGALKNLKEAWKWIDVQMTEFSKGKGRPRSICLRLESGEFRGLKFPDVKPGMIDDPL
jgi:hypothetical protein